MRSVGNERFSRDGAVDTDTALRDALAQESAEVLRHQVEAERRASVRLGRADLFVSFLLAGLGAGVGWAGASGFVTKRFGKRRSR